jgi:hypothetical protein
MNAVAKIATLFDNDITRQIEEVIKVDQTTEDIIASEIGEYVVTDAIKKHFVNVLEKYQTAPQNPSDNIAIWISGFFGSGKSSFAKVLGLAIEDRNILGTPAAKRFAARANDAKLNVVLNNINEKIPTHTVIFDVSTDRGIRSGNQMLTEIMYRLFLASLGYARAAVERHEEALDGVLVTMRSASLPGADFIDAAVSQMRGIRRGNEQNAILAFNASHKNIKDAIKRGADLENALTVSALADIEIARTYSLPIAAAPPCLLG